MGYTIQIQKATARWKSIQKAEELMYYLGIDFEPSCYIKGDRRDWLFREFTEYNIKSWTVHEPDGFRILFYLRKYSWLRRQRIKGLLDMLIHLGIHPKETTTKDRTIWTFTKDIIDNTPHGITLKRL